MLMSPTCVAVTCGHSLCCSTFAASLSHPLGMLQPGLKPSVACCPAEEGCDGLHTEAQMAEKAKTGFD